jgi:hypothetical protein
MRIFLFDAVLLDNCELTLSLTATANGHVSMSMRRFFHDSPPQSNSNSTVLLMAMKMQTSEQRKRFFFAAGRKLHLRRRISRVEWN